MAGRSPRVRPASEAESVLPGHVMPEFETVVEQHDHYWVVEKFTPDEVEQRLVTDAQQQ